MNLKPLASELSALLRRIDVLRGVGVKINQGHRRALVKAITLVQNEAKHQKLQTIREEVARRIQVYQEQNKS